MGSNQYRRFSSIGMPAADIRIAGQMSMHDAQKMDRRSRAATEFRKGNGLKGAHKLKVEIDPVYISD